MTGTGSWEGPARDMTPGEAVRVIAQHLVARYLTPELDTIAEDWEDCPLVGEHDWAAIFAQVETIAEWPSDEMFAAACQVLAARAEHAEAITADTDRRTTFRGETR